MLRCSALRILVFFWQVTLAFFVVLQPAVAATHEQFIESCKQSLMPQILACARAKGLTDHSAIRAQCGYAVVRACVIREEAKQAAGTPAPTAPKDDSAVAAAGAAPIQPTFVAPPRTITDITAILDSEKPDEAKISERKAKADAAPPSSASSAKLAEFYHQRGIARAALARNKEALADGLQALALAKGGVEPLLLHSMQRFVGLQYRALGDPKNAIATFEIDGARGRHTWTPGQPNQRAGQNRGDVGFHGGCQPGRHLCGSYATADRGGARQRKPQVAYGLLHLRSLLGSRSRLGARDGV